MGMRIIGLLIALFLLACTKPNPNVCCVDESDCGAKGIPVGSICHEGLVCRGNQCIAQPCSTGSDCDAAAPFCVAELCAENCVTDNECPGFGGDASHPFCVAGDCVACRDDNACNGVTPICDANACRACQHRDECESGICGTDGACVESTQIAYVSASGSSSSDCTQTAPCSIPRAVALSGLKYVLISAGSYSNAATVDVDEVRWFIGTGATRPRITNTGTGPIFRILPNSQTRWENLEIYGARNSGANRPYGSSLDAYDSGGGARHLELVDVALVQYEYAGLDCAGCDATITRSTFGNSIGAGGGTGIWANNATLTIDRSTFTKSTVGLYLYNGLYTITNSWFVRNTDIGISLCRSGTLSAQIEFSTIADNGFAAIQSCGESQPVFQNNLIVRNPKLVEGPLTGATYPGSIIAADATAVKFKSPDTQPYDYHITVGSSAIDQAVTSAVDHDADGQTRPIGAAADVGADEFQ